MANSNGKVILSLLAGATAGAVAGLLLAPETGATTRSSLKQAATDFGGDVSKFFQDTLSKVRGASTGVPNSQAAVSEDRAAADSLFNSMSSANDGSSQGAQGNESSYGASQASAFGSGGDNATTAGA